MAPVIIKDGKLLYHLTSLENLPSIIEHGLVPRRKLKENSFADIADSEIICERQRFNLDEYVPFHFHPRTPFDYAVRLNNPDTEFVYLCLSREIAKKNGFLILPKHPLSMESPVLYPYDIGFNLIDWETMQESASSSNIARSVRMAECLTEKQIQIKNLTQIAVKSEEVKKVVEEMLQNTSHPYINVQSTWF
jgi:hypothetical protein